MFIKQDHVDMPRLNAFKTKHIFIVESEKEPPVLESYQKFVIVYIIFKPYYTWKMFQSALTLPITFTQVSIVSRL